MKIFCANLRGDHQRNNTWFTGRLRKGLVLPTYNLYAIPNHPNYDLGQSPGSDTCEAIYTIAPGPSKNKATYLIGPNPVSD